MQKKQNAYSRIFFLNTLYKLIFCLYCLSACQNSLADQPENSAFKVTPAYYHWQTSLALSDKERGHLDSMNSDKLYLKFFDIDKKGDAKEPLPLARLQVDSSSYIPDTIIPTVFITNRSLLHLAESEVALLAERLYQLIEKLSLQLGSVHMPEIQIDCDWSAQTQENYFLLLKNLRDHHLAPNQQLSATIRLHQLKYPKKTGIPPVDRGMLMFYNMGEVTQWVEANSILNLEIASQYLVPAAPYPIPLDLALPLFRWGVLFRDGKMIKLINELGIEQLQDSSRFQQIDRHHVQVTKSTYLNGYYLYNGDQFRLEASEPSDLYKAVEMLKNYFPRKSFTLAYYHLDMPILQRFPHVVLSDLVEQFENRE